MEGHLGRELRTDEHVHHINGDRADDRLENLAVLSAVDHHRLHIEQGDTGRKPYKLTRENIERIVEGDEPARELAGEFGVSQGVIFYHRRKARVAA
jgi:hypothetical protein